MEADQILSYNNSAECITTESPTLLNSTEQPAPTETTSYKLSDIFSSIVIGIGLIGFVVNGLVLKVLLSPKLRNQISNILIINQVALDLISCILLVIDYGSKLTHMKYWGDWGFFVCDLIHSDLLVFVVLANSTAGVAVITAERYFKVVHSIAHRKYFRNWMMYAAIAMTWINGVLVNIPCVWTSRIIDGACTYFFFWPSQFAATVYSMFILVWEYIIPLVMFAYCYGHIVILIRSQMKVFNSGVSGTNNDSAAQQLNAQKSQMNVIATMIGISVAFVICWTPNQICYTLWILNIEVSSTTFTTTIFLIFLNTILNPFIYAAKHDAVRRGLKQMFGIKDNLGKGIREETTTKMTTVS